MRCHFPFKNNFTKLRFCLRRDGIQLVFSDTHSVDDKLWAYYTCTVFICVFFSFFNFQGFPFSVLWTLTKISDKTSFRIQVTYMVFEMIWLSGLMLTPKTYLASHQRKPHPFLFIFCNMLALEIMTLMYLVYEMIFLTKFCALLLTH